jgi:hypothetical protein
MVNDLHTTLFSYLASPPPFFIAAYIGLYSQPMQSQFPQSGISFNCKSFIYTGTTREHLTNVMPAVVGYVSDASISPRAEQSKDCRNTINKDFAMSATTTSVVSHQVRKNVKKRRKEKNEIYST